MTETDIAAPKPSVTQVDELRLFGIKVLIFCAIVGGVFYFVVSSLIEEARSALDSSMLKGGPEFWAQVDRKMMAFADQPDLPEAKKKQIIEALRKISKKYRPFIDALKE